MGLQGFRENAGFGGGSRSVATATRTEPRPLRRLEAIFIRGGELEKVLGHFHVNEDLVADII